MTCGLVREVVLQQVRVEACFVYKYFSYSKMPMYYLYVDFFSRFLSKYFVGNYKKERVHNTRR